MLCLSLPATLWAEGGHDSASDTPDMMSEDYIRAGLIVINPADEVYSLFGHCAIRLHCPSNAMDYCFTFETSTDTRGYLRFLQGTAKGGFLASRTADYLEAYRQAGRSVTEYRLNLTPKEKLDLWRTIDEEIGKGYCNQYGYMNTQCTSMLICVVNRALGTRIKYRLSEADSTRTFRDVMREAARSYPWSEFFWQTLMGPDGDLTRPMAHKQTPLSLPDAWRQATIGSEQRTLITGDGEQLVEAPASAGPGWFTPTLMGLLLLIATIAVTWAERVRGMRRTALITDIVLLAIHTAISAALIWLVVFSEQEGTSWNWYLPAYNLLPLLLWLCLPRWRRAVCGCTAAVMALTIVATPFIAQLDLPHALITAVFALRLASRATPLPQR